MVCDLDSAAVITQIKEACGPAKARSVPPPYLAAEPPQTASRIVVEEAAVELGHVHLSWHIPDLRHADVPLLDVLAAILGGGRSSRLHPSVREKQGLVHSVDAWTVSPCNPGLFCISALPDGQQIPSSRDPIPRQVSQVLTRGVSAAENPKALE